MMLEPIDLEKFKEVIRHSVDENGAIEFANTSAYLLDSKDILDLLGFHNIHAFKKVDYFTIDRKEKIISLIELTDLTREIEDCMQCQLLLELKPSYIRKYLKENSLELAKLEKKMWLEVLEEFRAKFLGAMLCCERLLRINQEKDVFDYKFVIVFKNETNPKEFKFLDTYLRKKLNNMTRNLRIITTQQL